MNHLSLKRLEMNGFKSFGKKALLSFETPITGVVGPNGSGKSNIVESFRFVLGEQSMKSMRGKSGSDLIFKGSKGMPSSSRASVAITFDNTNKVFSFTGVGSDNVNLDFDEITIAREVFSDGGNKYSINGSEVRLKDIIDLLASVNIGSSGHHIISQGEADRILSSSSKDRRMMIEDALGLKVYQYRIAESERKLEKTQINMKEVGALRREIAPHITFLKKQVEKIEKAQVMRGELTALYKEYFSKEAFYLRTMKESLHSKRYELETKLRECEKNTAYGDSNENKTLRERTEELAVLERTRGSVRQMKEDLSRKIGRLEGIIEALESSSVSAPQHKDSITLSSHEADSLVAEIGTKIDEALATEDIASISTILKNIKTHLTSFFETRTSGGTPDTVNRAQELEHHKKTFEEITTELGLIEVKEKELESQIAILRRKIDEEREALRNEERLRYESQAKEREIRSELSMLSLKEETIQKFHVDFENELAEARVLVGHEATVFTEESSGEEDRVSQEEKLKKIERIKIKLEDAGGAGGSEVMKEYEEATARDTFLARELSDLTDSIVSLRNLITELKQTLDREFNVGIEKINKEFQNFFALMFGGGSAFLSVVIEHKRARKNTEELDEEVQLAEDAEEGEKEFERGIEINVSLPKKKVKDLHMLSGGERSLTSIALLFAMSQVNPPPFLVLDETDAALDEANSRKYGDMLESLSKYSQLIVVTHNRETMSRAQVLYGITMGAEGASKLLSIKLEEAVAIAK